MALNTTLLTLRSMLKAEIGASLSVGTQQDSTYNQLLATKQQLLVAEFDFPYLEDRWDVNVTGGGRYFSLPTTDQLGNTYSLDTTRPFLVERYWNQYYDKLEYGIGSEQFNYLNSDLNQTLDPVQRWRWIQNKTGSNFLSEFEIWPIPSTAQTIRFTGTRTLNALAVDADKADVDDLLLVLSVAVEILTRSEKPDAQLRLQNAQRRLQQLRAAYPEEEDEPAVFGRNYRRDKELKRVVPITVTVHG